MPICRGVILSNSIIAREEWEWKFTETTCTTGLYRTTSSCRYHAHVCLSWMRYHLAVTFRNELTTLPTCAPVCCGCGQTCALSLFSLRVVVVKTE